jgi:hypothetical protein
MFVTTLLNVLVVVVGLVTALWTLSFIIQGILEGSRIGHEDDKGGE